MLPNGCCKLGGQHSHVQPAQDKCRSQNVLECLDGRNTGWPNHNNNNNKKKTEETKKRENENKLIFTDF
jgi:hypothetical protein